MICALGGARCIATRTADRALAARRHTDTRGVGLGVARR